MRFHDRALLTPSRKPHSAPSSEPPADATPNLAPRTTDNAEAPFLCERCRAAMYRMHAVWRCPGCGFKTDCCGW